MFRFSRSLCGVCLLLSGLAPLVSACTTESGDPGVATDGSGGAATKESGGAGGSAQGSSEATGSSGQPGSATAASGVGASSGAASAATGGGTSNDAAELCVNTINQYRATLGLPPYQRWTEKEVCASEQATKDAASNTAHGAFGQCTEFAQNECPGWPAPAEKMITGCLAQMWAEGPGTDFPTHGHYINMSSTKYTKVACGFSAAANGHLWATQDFR